LHTSERERVSATLGHPADAMFGLRGQLPDKFDVEAVAGRHASRESANSAAGLMGRALRR
jgi:hypothetical protein